MNEIKVKINLGTILKAQRERLGISLEQAHHKTRINSKYLAMLEENFFDFSESEVVIQNYIRSYSKLLKLNESMVVELYKTLPKFAKEKNIELVKNKDINNNFSPLTLFLSSILLLALLITNYKNQDQVATPPNKSLEVPIMIKQQIAKPSTFSIAK